MHKYITACFSKSGRTKKIAEYISQELNAPLHEITTEKTYPKSYVMTILEARKEFKKDERPALTSRPIENLADYDRIIIGFPVWFWTCPMAVVSFLEQNDLTGKDIYPFCTSGGSNCDKAAAKIREICKGSNVHDGIKANSMDKSKLSEWLKD